MGALLLLFHHGLENRYYPVFEQTVIGVGNDHISDSIEAFLSKLSPLERKVSDIGRRQALRPHPANILRMN